MRKSIMSALVLTAILTLPVLASAASWAVVAANFVPPVIADGEFWDDREAIFMVNLGSNPPRYYGPFLQGLLSDYSGGGVFDVAVLPNGREALISNFGDSKVFRVDISKPKAPVVTGELKMTYDTVDEFGAPVTYSIFAEDIAVSPDGKWAVVADGGFSPYICFIDLQSFTVKSIQKLAIPDPIHPDDPLLATPVYANAVAISPNGRTVLLADYFQGFVAFGRVNLSRNALTNLGTIFLCDNVDPLDPKNCLGNLGRPVNITISPDGLTAITALASTSFDPGGVNTPVGAVAVLRLTRHGVVPGRPFFVTGLPTPDALTPPGTVGGNQSVAFTPDGLNAFVVTQPIGEVLDPDPDPADPPGAMVNRVNVLAKLKIARPGQAVLKKANYAQLGGRGTSQLFGVDTLAISRLGGWMIASNPTLSGFEPVLRAVNYITGAKRTITFPKEVIPVGVAFKR